MLTTEGVEEALSMHDLLDEFTRQKLAAAPATTLRAGVPRDGPKQFGQGKVRAAIDHLRLRGDLDDLRAVAREADVSPSLLGKWRTEARFRAHVKSLEEEFVGSVAERIKESGAAALALLPGARRWAPDIRLRILKAVVEQTPPAKTPVDVLHANVIAATLAQDPLALSEALLACAALIKTATNDISVGVERDTLLRPLYTVLAALGAFVEEQAHEHTARAYRGLATSLSTLRKLHGAVGRR